MTRIKTELFASFNPILRPFFRCPVCNGDKFVYLAPYAGLWCERCNANIEIASTSDGPSKVGIRVHTEWCHASAWREAFEKAWSILWASDTEISWIFYKSGKILDGPIEPIIHP